MMCICDNEYPFTWQPDAIVCGVQQQNRDELDRAKRQSRSQHCASQLTVPHFNVRELQVYCGSPSAVNVVHASVQTGMQKMDAIVMGGCADGKLRVWCDDAPGLRFGVERMSSRSCVTDQPIVFDHHISSINSMVVSLSVDADGQTGPELVVTGDASGGVCLRCHCRNTL